MREDKGGRKDERRSWRKEMAGNEGRRKDERRGSERGRINRWMQIYKSKNK